MRELAVSAILALAAASAADETEFVLWKSAAVTAGPQARVAVAPVFPKALASAPAGVTVVLEVELEPDGRVRRVRVVEGSQVAPIESAMRAIVAWRFEPSGSSGRQVRVTFVFRTMPATTPAEDLATIFRGKYEVEVRQAR